MVCVQIGGVLFAVPMRSHIKHKYALWADKENHCGVDFSKAVSRALSPISGRQNLILSVAKMC